MVIQPCPGTHHRFSLYSGFTFSSRSLIRTVKIPKWTTVVKRRRENVLRPFLGHMGMFPVHKSVAGGVVGSIWKLLEGVGGLLMLHMENVPPFLFNASLLLLRFIILPLVFWVMGLFFFLGYLLCFHPKSRRSLFLLKLGSFQFAVLKIVFTILSIVLYTNDLFDLSDVSRVTPNNLSFLGFIWHFVVAQVR